MPRSEHDPLRPSSTPAPTSAPTPAPSATPASSTGGEATGREPTGRDATDGAVLYRERLWPSFWVWLVCIGVAAGSLVVFAPINMTAGIVAFVVLAGLLVFALTRSAATIVVTPAILQVGRAQIERRYLGEVAGFRHEEARVQRGMELNARSYQCIRGWVDPVVTVGITDPADATPYWITSTRHPEQLVAALISDAPPAR